jgi:diacylglycerol kinase family enzyme
VGRSADTCVIYNPEAGRGRARSLIRRLMRRYGSAAYELRPTDAAGHAEALAAQAVREGFPRVAAAGGDGTVHEVANGLLSAGPGETVFAVWPVGSANDYAFALGLHDCKPLFGKSRPRVRAVDVGRITGDGGRQRWFVNGLGVGFNGAVTLESRAIRRLRGLPLYAMALLRAVAWHFTTPKMSIRLDDRLLEGPTLALSVGLGQREGNFPLMPKADLCDGLFDYLRAGKLKRWELLRYLPGMATGNLPTDHPLLDMGRCRSVEVRSESPVRVHLDGEFFCHPEDGVRNLTIELLPKALRVETYGRTTRPEGRAETEKPRKRGSRTHRCGKAAGRPGAETEKPRERGSGV